IARDFSAAVGYGELTSVESDVVERPSWIATRVKIRGRDVPFMRRGGRAPLSDEVSVVYQGGKLFIGDVLVRTDGAISLSAGQRCLMFLSAPASNSQDWGLAQFYGILTDETLVDGYGNTVLEPPDDKALTLERL